MRMRRWSLMAAVLLLLPLILTACSGGGSDEIQNILQEKETVETEDEENVTWILMTHSEELNSATHEVATYLAKQLKEISGGRLQISVYGNNSLGNLEDSVNSVCSGTVQMRIGTVSSSLTNILRWLPILNDADIDDIEKALEPGTTFRAMQDEELESKNVKLMGTLPVNYRVLTSDIPLTSVEDFSKLRFRTVFTGLESSIWNALGAEAAAFSVEKVYLALQMDYINSQENTISSIVSNRLYEHQKYVTSIRMRVYMDQIFVNQEFYDSLTAEQQGWLDQAVEKAVAFGSNRMHSYNSTALRHLAEEGIQIDEFPAEERERMAEIVRPLVYENLVERSGEEVVRKVMGIVY